MIRNERAAGDSRHARTGKDGAFYSEDGVLLATVDTFTSNVNWNNAKYSVLGDAQEHETANTFAVSLTMSQIVVELPGLTSRPQWFRGTCGLQGVYSFRTGRHSECHCRRCYQEKLELLCQQTA